MAFEGPVCVLLISLLSKGESATFATAVFNPLMAYSLFLETPIIDLLATSTTLATNSHNRKMLRKFVAIICGMAMGLHAIACLPPVYARITSNLEKSIADALYMPFFSMITWTGWIGWRRYRQGLMIRAHKTSLIGFGTVIRFAALVIASLVCYWLKVPIILCVTWGLLASVIAEAFVIFFLSRNIEKDLPENNTPPASMGKMWGFHAPLMATTMLNLGTFPLITLACARASDPELHMAAWQLSLSFVWLFRTAVYALPELVISTYSPENEAHLRRFCLIVGGVLSGIMAVLAITGAPHAAFAMLPNQSPGIVPLAAAAFGIQFALPLLGAFQNYIRGVLTALHFTKARMYSVAVGFSTLLIVLAAGAYTHTSGVQNASLALTLSLITEAVALVIALNLVRKRITTA